MEIKLSEKQLSVLKKSFDEQESLRLEIQKIQKRVDDVVFVILDSHGVEPVQGMEIKDGVLIVPETKLEVVKPESATEEAK